MSTVPMDITHAEEALSAFTEYAIRAEALTNKVAKLVIFADGSGRIENGADIHFSDLNQLTKKLAKLL